MSEAVTQNIRVEVNSEYIADESQPENNNFFFSYHVKITNEGSEVVQLISRHWIITDANGRSEEVRGPGVIGQQPILRPGQAFTYSSFCPLQTPLGTMHGTYQMLENGAKLFDVQIAPFTLNVPGIIQ